MLYTSVTPADKRAALRAALKGRETRLLGPNSIGLANLNRRMVLTANAAFADGHAEPIAGDSFPRGAGGSNPIDEVRAENRGGGPTVYADPNSIP